MEVKRPLLWSLVFFILGIWMASQAKNLIVIMTVLLYLAMYCLYRRYIWRGFFLMPILFIVGVFYTLVMEYDYSQVATILEEGETHLEATVINVEKFYEDDKVKCTMELNQLRGKVIPGKTRYFICYLQDEEAIRPGNRYKVYGTLKLPAPSRNPGEFNEQAYYKSVGHSFKVYAERFEFIETKWKIVNILNVMKTSLANTFDLMLPQEEAAVVKTMIMGSSYESGSGYYDIFRELGIIHVLAISGLHITLIFYSFFLILKKTGLKDSYGYVLTLVVIFFYGVMTGFSVSTQRAFIMFTVIVMGNLLGRRGDIYTSLAVAACCMLILNPFSLYQIGFQLSFIALLGIVLSSQVLSKFVNIQSKLLSLCSASLGAFLLTWPIIAYHFYHVSIYGLFMNLFIVPIMSVLIIISFIAGGIGSIWIGLGRFLIGGVYYIIKCIGIVGNYLAGLPFGYLLLGQPHVIMVFAYYALLAFILISLLKKNFHKYAQIGALMCLLIGVSLLMIPKRHQVTILDVGQGDSAVIRTVDGDTFIIDGGKEKGAQILKSYLDYMGVKKVDGIFVSHTDQDHIQGIIALLPEIQLDYLFLAKQPIQENQLLRDLIVQAEVNNVTTLYMETGDNLNCKDLDVNVLAPDVDTNYPSNNDSSMVLSINLDEISILFTGDIENNGEDLLLQNGIGRYEILKVAHHGSNTSSGQEFIEKVKPIIGIISCGLDNVYGHPHKDVVKRLEKEGVVLYNTSTDGAILIEIDEETIKLRNWLRDE
ncbi:DNA internalization-related competence protein ComEC/Rec2 [Vallitalea okinawensis]|uniref:DNA internalization-related competence protein ComEC/Rec2 n=1 Tax=Vallitalea okinawensis TaxID=2078660 RepID=UPI000CFAD6FC|nr:DNA internalization-related competence protein ComEC/Rec2 [Vallitalea okinawensis]